ncbi:uncharacterized protein BDZ99DRAFT_215947 [Mytilinidion resinicola]|uniref:DUF1996 domain-containing protein n=1 Tax=Mytilinidion resinicola TaxID=574789 RepID=A0A6A6XZ87_9PEZI|nr:uncharacterized protein BDZ99DRAFT_215947 [Mytilinidion resinicola]KAF2801709.1 hypothetical protein BDZ99DRAFT_215947 [Mytilinidion resinicola]
MATSSKVTSPMAAAALLLASLSGVNAFWRMDCHSPLGLARIDPLVDYGKIAAHSHIIFGGDNFSPTAGYDDLIASESTSCRAKEDKSAYWTPSLHFQHSDGTFEVVGNQGGMLAYYFLRDGGTGQQIKAFPAGFQMIAGDTNKRNFTGPVPDPPESDWTADELTQASLAEKALGFNCLNYASGKTEPSLFRHFLPDKSFLDANCADGIRLELSFPACWNEAAGVAPKGSKSHVAYPNLVQDGVCPEGFSTRLPGLFYETIWRTQDFVGKDGQFVLSNGDPTGYGYHGDFIAGWDVPTLQKAVDTCTNLDGTLESCPVFTLQTQPEMAAVKLSMPADLKNENCAGPESTLPGNVPIQSGPQPATDNHGGVAAPTYAPSSYAAPSKPVVPTVSPKKPVYSKPSYPGSFSIQDIQNAGVASTSRIATSEASSTSAAVYVAVTPAPSAPAETDGGSIIGTTTYTSDGAVWEVAIKEIDITVTAEPTGAARRRRHLAQHRHIGDSHGL